MRSRLRVLRPTKGMGHPILRRRRSPTLRSGERATAAPRGWLGGPYRNKSKKFFGAADVRNYPNNRARALLYAMALGPPH